MSVADERDERDAIGDGGGTHLGHGHDRHRRDGEREHEERHLLEDHLRCRRRQHGRSGTVLTRRPPTEASSGQKSRSSTNGSVTSIGFDREPERERRQHRRIRGDTADARA